jgi:hypothetical protein
MKSLCGLGWTSFIATTLLQGCMVLPKTEQVYDRDCQMAAKHMTLEAVQVAAIQGCANEGCVALVVAATAVTAASAIVSGTIVLAGNVAYWFERNAQCRSIP